jgi:hemolysin III
MHRRHNKRTIFSSIKSTNNNDDRRLSSSEGTIKTEVVDAVEAVVAVVVAEEGGSSSSSSSSNSNSSNNNGIYVDKPILRGQFHKWGAILYPFLFGLPLYFRAIKSTAITSSAITSSASTVTSDSNNSILVVSTILFNIAVESIMIISATLHTYKWKSNYWHTFTRKLDFTGIFVGIALLYSSMGKLLLGNNPKYIILECIVWLSAIIGTVIKWFIPDCPHYINGIIFILQGWIALPYVPTLFRTCHINEVIGILSGAIFVTLGAVAYSLQWPKPKLSNSKLKLNPKLKQHNNLQQQKILPSQRDIIFGPHELFHVSSLFMFLSFWYTMWFNVSSSSSS